MSAHTASTGEGIDNPDLNGPMLRTDLQGVADEVLYVDDTSLQFLTIFGRFQFKSLEHLLDKVWFTALIFSFIESIFLLRLGDTFFGTVTLSAFKTTTGYSRVVKVHVWVCVFFWGLGAVQVLGKSLRADPSTAWIHRLSGYIFLLTYWLVVLPTSFWLGLHQRITHGGPFVTAILLEIAVSSAYFFYRALAVIRARRNGDSSLVLHGKLMRCGLAMTMAILPQRTLQLGLTCIWWLVFFVQSVVCPPCDNASKTTESCCNGVAFGIPGHQWNYTLSMVVTSSAFFWFGHFLDGPRAWLWRSYLGRDHIEEAYGSREALRIERILWLARWPCYGLLYFLFNPLSPLHVAWV